MMDLLEDMGLSGGINLSRYKWWEIVLVGPVIYGELTDDYDWQRMGEAEREVFVIDAVRGSVNEFLQGKITSVEVGVQRKMAEIYPGTSWNDWKNANQKYMAFIHTANKELKEALTLTELYQTNPEQAKKQLKNKKWRFVVKKQFEALFFVDSSSPSFSDFEINNQASGGGGTSFASISGGIINWAMANPIPAIGIVGASVVGLIFMTGKPKNQKQLAAKKPPKKIALQGLK